MDRHGKNRRSLLLGGGACTLAGLIGGFSLNRSWLDPISAQPSGVLLLSRLSQNGRGRLLIAYDPATNTERELEAESGTSFLSIVPAPDQQHVALLKRISRGSMPTDSIVVYDRATLTKRALVETQIAFQRVPTYMLSWEANMRRVAVPYNNAGRTLIYNVRPEQIGLHGMFDRAFFQFHPTNAGVALYESSSDAEIAVIGEALTEHEHPIEQIAGMEARWSPNGQWLAYQSKPSKQANQGSALIIRNEQHPSEQRELALKPLFKVWSPDSRSMALYSLGKSDPLGIGRYLTREWLPGYQPNRIAPHLLTYDPVRNELNSIGAIPAGFQIAKLLWLNQDWLLVASVNPHESFLIDRHGQHQQRLLINESSPILAWIAR
ncbi:MAG: hypothetical protein Fur005_48680 [Roseiflexaceae bacterium]